MSITDELRRWAEDRAFVMGESGFARRIAEFCDRIDAEHESEISRAAQLLADAEKDRDFNYANWQDCKQKVLQHNITIDELDAEIERLKDRLARCIALPVDADGEPIHVGDKVVEVDGPAVPHAVTSINLAGDGWWVYINGVGCRPGKYLHYHEPTVEDVLDEIVDKANSIGCAYAKNDISGEEMMGALQAIVAEYAAKLRLAGDGE